MDPALPTQLLVGDEDLAHLGGTAGFNASSQRFHHVLHLAMASGEQEKLAQVEQMVWGRKSQAVPARARMAPDLGGPWLVGAWGDPSLQSDCANLGWSVGVL